MGRNHIKSIAAPKTWVIERKAHKYRACPNPGGQKLQHSMPLSLFMSELAKVARSAREIKYIISKKDVFVDKKKRTDERYSVGLMDIVEFPQLEEQYRMLLDSKGRLTAVKANEKESKLKLTKITSKTLLAKAKVQLNTSDGRNIIIPKDSYKTGDTLLIELPEQKIAEHYPLQKGALVLLTGGKHAGTIATVEDISADKIILKAKKESFESSKSHAFVIGKDKPALESIKQLTEKAKQE